jgi:hypothetical protein
VVVDQGIDHLDTARPDVVADDQALSCVAPRSPTHTSIRCAGTTSTASRHQPADSDPSAMTPEHSAYLLGRAYAQRIRAQMQRLMARLVQLRVENFAGSLGGRGLLQDVAHDASAGDPASSVVTCLEGCAIVVAGGLRSPLAVSRHLNSRIELV